MKFPALLQRMTVFAVLAAVFFSLFAPFVSAQEYAPIPPARQHTFSDPIASAIQDPKIERNAQVAFIQVGNMIVCQLTGYDMLKNGEPCMAINVSSGNIQFSKQENPKMIGGLIGQVVMMIGNTYNMPVHTSDYTSYLADNFGFAKTTYAQTGTGFNSLRPLLSMWTRIRDLCYLAFVVLFVLVGFGIMMRIKIDPRTVMSIQNQIPKIIIAILLITFSYAIAGFLVDAMWTVTYIGINVLTAETTCTGGNTLTSVATNNLLTTPLAYVNRLFAGDGCSSGWGIGDLAVNIGWALGELLTSGFAALFSGQNTGSGNGCLSWVGVDFGECIKEGLNLIFTFIFRIVATMVVFLAILVQLVRVWFMLIKAYFYVIMYTLLGPFYILLGLIPGTQNFGVEQWLRYMVSALLMFPFTAFIFIVAVILANNTEFNNPAATQHFVPPLLGNPSLANNMGMIVALGAILISPEVVNMMRNAFKASPSKYTPQIFKGLGAGMGPVQGMGNRGWGMMTRAGDPSSGDKGGLLRRVVQGDPSKLYWKTRTDQFGNVHRYTDYSKTPLRFKAGEMLFGRGK